MFKRLKALVLPLAILAVMLGFAPTASAILSETRVGGYQLFDAASRQVETTQTAEPQQASGFAWYDTVSECSVAAKNLPFKPGEIIVKEMATSRGTLEMAAETVIEGKVLHLKDIAIFPKGAESFELGAKEVMALRAQLAAEAKSLGFESLRITGKRLTGANPGKLVDVTIDLTK
ncbi:MAG: hypothetical protein M9910_08995 [Kiritimatiellae bacterium]|nr:hypothetical protein [Kiritimatiellia bacterium]